jgi:hypothetical protein
MCGIRPFQGSSLIQHLGLTQATVHHGKNDQSRKTVDANKQISGCYYQSIDSQESDHLNQVNENIEYKACDNDAFISVEKEFQGDIGASDYNINSD